MTSWMKRSAIAAIAASALLTAGMTSAHAAEYGQLKSCSDPGPLANWLQTSGTCGDARDMLTELKNSGFKGASKSGLRCFTKNGDAKQITCVKFDKKRGGGSAGTVIIGGIISQM